jgi:Ca2+-binding EF-hand superfamily protein
MKTNDNTSSRNSKDGEKSTIKSNDNDEDIINAFSFEVLEPVTLDILSKNLYLPEEILKLRECFFLLDPKKKGYIKKERFYEIFKKEQEDFTDEQMDNFFKFVLSSKDQDYIYYENYCLDLVEYVQNHLQNLGINY